MTDTTGAVNAVRAAIRLEQNSLRFYSLAAEAADDPREKRAFLAFARDEQEHLRKLQIELTSLEESSQWLSLGALMVEGKVSIDLEEFFPDTGMQPERKARPSDADIDSMRLAAKMEEDNYIFYANSAEEAKDPSARAIYSYLADQEANHLQLVNTLLEALEQPSDWT